MKPRKILDSLGLKEPRAAGDHKKHSRQPAHRYFSLEDVKAGRVPKPTAKELAQRQEAIRMAHEIRSKLNILPLTAPAIIRELRNGTELDE